MSKRNLIIALAAILTMTSLAGANGLNLNGLGTRAQAMGGAFVGIADDFSAVFWNPAGAAGFRKDVFGFYAVDLIPRATYQLESAIPEVPYVDARTQKSHYLGFLGAYYKPVGSKVVVGLGIGTPSGLGTIWNGEDFTDLSGGTSFQWSSKVGAFSLSPLVAVRLTDRISIGAALNVTYGMFNLKMPGGIADLAGAQADLGQYEENMLGWGLGATIGVLVKLFDKLGLGLTVRTPSTVSFDGTASLSYLSIHGRPDTSDIKRKITWPLWIAGGLSFRPIERLLLSADVQWTQWSKLDQWTTEYLETAWAEILAESQVNVRVKEARILNWADRAQLRFGAEYALNASMALRAGYCHDPAPGPDATLDVLLPTHTFNAFSLGVGKAFGDLRLDFGLEYLAGNTRKTGWVFFAESGMGGTYGMRIIVPSVSASYKF